MLETLNIKEDLVVNNQAKIAIRKRIHRAVKKQKKTVTPKGIKHEETRILLKKESSDVGSGFETSKEDRSQQEAKNWESFAAWKHFA